MPQYFRFLTLLAFKVFNEEKVIITNEISHGRLMLWLSRRELVGGFLLLIFMILCRTDATNILSAPIVCGITPIGFDHMNVLGNTLTEIAFEKSGIFKVSFFLILFIV